MHLARWKNRPGKYSGDANDAIARCKSNYHIYTMVGNYGLFLVVVKKYYIINMFLEYPPEHPSSSPVFSRVCVARALIFCVLYCKSLFVLFPLIFVLSVLRLTGARVAQ